MSLENIYLVLAIHAVALISPGPDFAVVTRLSIVSGRHGGLLAAAGISTAIGLYLLICVFGLSAALSALPGLSVVLSVVGAAYLGWLGVQCLRSRGALPVVTSPISPRKAYSTGLMTNLLNPKAMLYFGSVLSQALSPAISVADTSMLVLLLITESFLWFALVALVFSSNSVIRWLRSRLVWFERAVGLILVGLAVKVATNASR